MRSVNDAKPILFLPNHPALMDPPLLYSCLWSFHPRPLADENQANRPLVRWLATLLRPILVPDIRKKDDRRVALFWRPCNNAPNALNAGDIC